MKNKNPVRLANVKMLEFAATKLGKMCDDVVFLGGCTTGLFITDPNSPDIRYTFDVDCIVEVVSLNQYYQLEKNLRKQGFKKSLSEDIICRWLYDDLILDVMPSDEKILGFGNRWYKEAIASSTAHSLTDQIKIRIVTAPYFLATKLEAFKTRGKMDFYASHDFEDIVSVLDGRIEIIDEIKNSDKNLKEYLIQYLFDITNNRAYKGAIPGHFVQYGSLANDRVELFEKKMIAIKIT